MKKLRIISAILTAIMLLEGVPTAALYAWDNDTVIISESAAEQSVLSDVPMTPIEEIEAENTEDTAVYHEISQTFASGTGAKEDPYIIINASQLALLADRVNSGAYDTDGTAFNLKSYRLGADIVINQTDAFVYDAENYIQSGSEVNPPYSWIPIGKFSDDKTLTFGGIFDGDHHTVSGIYIDSNSDYIGMFGYVYGTDAQIKNINLTNSYIKGHLYAGNVAAYNDGGTIFGCVNNLAYIKVEKYYGSIVGYNKGIIDECENNSKVVCAGINGYNEGTVRNCINNAAAHVGIVGNNFGFVNDCINHGYVRSTSGYQIGGIVGLNKGEVNNCDNHGDVDYIGTESDTYVGGIVGYNYGKIYLCDNYGYISSQVSQQVGGITGVNQGTVLACNNYGDVEGYNTIGGIAGSNYSGSISYCSVGNNTDNTGSNYLGIFGEYITGGICGENNAEINNCSNNMIIYVSDFLNDDPLKIVGGIAATSSGDINNCYNTGYFDYFINSSSTYVDVIAGGIVGDNAGKVKYCYNIGYSFSSYYYYYYEAQYGGVIGYNTALFDVTTETPWLHHNYCRTNTVIADDSSNRAYNEAIIEAYFNETDPEWLDLHDMTPGDYYDMMCDMSFRTDEELTLQSSYIDYDFENVWKIDDSSGYKYAQLIGYNETYSYSGINSFSLYGSYNSAVELKWTFSDHSAIISSYKLYRDGTMIAEVAHDVDTYPNIYADTGLSANTLYNYTVCAYDADGNKVGDERALTATTVAPQISNVTTSAANSTTGGDSTVTINAYAINSNNLSSATGKFEYSSDSEAWMAIIGCSQYSLTNFKTEWNTAALESGLYYLRFTLTDKYGSSVSKAISITVDNDPPAKIQNLTVVTESGSNVLSWSVAAELDTTCYHVYRRLADETDFTRIAVVNGRSNNGYKDSSVSENDVCEYAVAGVDKYGLEGERSDSVTIAVSGDVDPPVIASVLPVTGITISGLREISVTASDNIAVALIKLFISTDGDTWQLLCDNSADSDKSKLSYTLDTTIYDDGVIRIKAVSFDAADNVSDGNPIRSWKVDNTGPSKVIINGYEAYSTSVFLKFSDVQDEDRGWFILERSDDGVVSSVGGKITTVNTNITGLLPSTEYIYRVTAFDIYGNRGVSSDWLTVTTLPDTSAPVVTSISPSPSRFNDVIALSAAVKDDVGVYQTFIETSRDGSEWSIYNETVFAEAPASLTLKKNIVLTDFEEGLIYVRVIALDKSGNKSLSDSTAPYVQYIVDRTPPSAPSGLTVSALTGYNEISWTQGVEADIRGYTVFRSESSDGVYGIIADNISSLNYFDRDITLQSDYYYRVSATDTAGNVGQTCDYVHVTALGDDVAPVVESISPASGSVISPTFNKIGSLVSDNHRIDSVTLSYRRSDETEFISIAEESAVNDYYFTIYGQLPVLSFTDGEAITVRASVSDASGNTTYSDYVYTVDVTAPVVTMFTAEKGDFQTQLDWTAEYADDLSGFKLYKKVGDSAYKLITQRAASGVEYFYTDTDIQNADRTYTYKLEAFDKAGNFNTYTSEPVTFKAVNTAPNAVISCDNYMEIGVQYEISALLSTDDDGICTYSWDFGDGTASELPKVVHQYDEIGEYNIKLTVTDAEGLTSEQTKLITVSEREVMGSVTITVADDTGKHLADFPIYINLGESDQSILYTDGAGKAKYTAPVGSVVIGAYKSGYLPAKQTANLTAIGSEVNFTVVADELVTGTFEIKHMTLAEIIAAGIDISDPANQQIIRVDVVLTYGAQIFNFSYFANDNGPILDTSYIIEDTDDNSSTKKTYTRELTPVHIPTINNYKVIALVDIPVEASFLKDFFNVKLHILNKAESEFALVDNVVTLNVPDGLSLMDTDYSLSEPVAYIDTIQGGETSTLNWILRGDTAGEYDISADYSGRLSEFNENVSAVFKAKNKVKVSGAEAVEINFITCDTYKYNTLYFDVELINKSDHEINLPQLIIEKTFDGKPITLRQTYIESDSGKASAPQTVTVLGVGEKLVKRYAIYDFTCDYDLKGELKEAFVKNNDTGVDITLTDENLGYFTGVYDDENSELLIDTFKNERAGAVSYLTYDGNYCGSDLYYYMNEIYCENSDISYALTIPLLFRHNSEVGYIHKLLNFEYIGDAIDSIINLDATYLFENDQIEANKTLLGEMIATCIEDNYDAALLRRFKQNALNFLSAVENAASADEILYQVVTEVNGVIDIYELAALFEYAGIYEIKEYYFGKLRDCYNEDNKNGGYDENINVIKKLIFDELLVKAYFDIDGMVLPALTIDKVLSENLRQLCRDACELYTIYYETTGILNTLITLEGLTPTVREAAKDLIKTAEDNLKNANSVIIDFCVDIIKNAVSEVIIKGIEKLFPSIFGRELAIINMLFNSIYKAYYEDKIEATRNCSANYLLCNTFTRGYLNAIDSGNDTDAVAMLSYLSTARIEGEILFGEYYKTCGLDFYELEINDMSENYEHDVDEWLNDKITAIIKMRDEAFLRVFDNGLAEMPELSADCYSETTLQSFDDSYESRLNLSEWLPCDNTRIDLIPLPYIQILEVRRRAYGEAPAGNTACITINSRPEITTAIKAAEQDGKTIIAGLSSDYCYQAILSDTVIDGDPNWGQSTYISGEAVENEYRVKIDGTGKFLYIRIAAHHGDDRYNGNFCSDYSVYTVGDAANDYVFRLKDDHTYEIIGYVGEGGIAVIPSCINEIPVTSIGTYAFRDNTTIKKITVPDTVTGIGEGAFYDCNKLMKVILPDGLSSLPNFVFSGCSSLNHITLPTELESIGREAFADCSRLANISIPSGVVNIEYNAFMFCVSMSDAYFKGDTPSSFSNSAFTQTDLDFGIYADKNNTGWTFPDWHGFDTMYSDSGFTVEDVEYRFDFNADDFIADADIYSDELARLACGMIFASGSAEFELNYGDEENSGREFNIQRIYDQLGFTDVVYRNYNKPLSDSSNKVAFSIAKKYMNGDNGEYTLVTVPVRGMKYGAEWVSNFDIEGVNAVGFMTAATEVYEEVKSYLNHLYQNGEIHGELKIFINGHSRGAAVANCAARMLSDYSSSCSYIKSKNVYAYCLATPNNTSESGILLYGNIHNIIYGADMIPMVPLKSWGFYKVGNINYFNQNNDKLMNTVSENYYALIGSPCNIRDYVNQTRLLRDGERVVSDLLKNTNDYNRLKPIIMAFLSVMNYKFKDSNGEWTDNYNCDIYVSPDNLIENMIDEAYLKDDYTQRNEYQLLKKTIGYYIETGVPKETVREKLQLSFKEIYVLANKYDIILNNFNISLYDIICQSEMFMFITAVNLAGIMNGVNVSDTLFNVIMYIIRYLALDIILPLISKNSTILNKLSSIRKIVECIILVIDFVRGYLSEQPFTPHTMEVYTSWLISGDKDQIYQKNKWYMFITACPVDIDIYDCNGNLVVRIVNDTVIYSSIPAYIDGDDKKVYFMGGSDDVYSIKIIGTDEGEMDYSLTEITDGEEERSLGKNDISISDSMIITAEAGGDNNDVLVTRDSDGNTSGTIALEDVYYFNASAGLDGTITGADDMYISAGSTVEISVEPRMGYRFTSWTTDDDEALTTNGIFADENSASTTFTIGAQNVNVYANFTPLTDNDVDVNDDGRVDVLDMIALQNDMSRDINNDGTVSMLDILSVQSFIFK